MVTKVATILEKKGRKFGRSGRTRRRQRHFHLTALRGWFLSSFGFSFFKLVGEILYYIRAKDRQYNEVWRITLRFQSFSGPVSTDIQSTCDWKPVGSQPSVDRLVELRLVCKVDLLPVFFFSYLVSFHFLVTREASVCQAPEIIFLAVHEQSMKRMGLVFLSLSSTASHRSA